MDFYLLFVSKEKGPFGFHQIFFRELGSYKLAISRELRVSPDNEFP